MFCAWCTVWKLSTKDLQQVLVSDLADVSNFWTITLTFTQCFWPWALPQTSTVTMSFVFDNLRFPKSCLRFVPLRNGEAQTFTISSADPKVTWGHSVALTVVDYICWWRILNKNGSIFRCCSCIFSIWEPPNSTSLLLLGVNSEPFGLLCTASEVEPNPSRTGEGQWFHTSHSADQRKDEKKIL